MYPFPYFAHSGALIAYGPDLVPAFRSAAGYESSGLGLAFCRLAVEAQGGTIRIEDRTPRGNVFVVELPR